VKHIDEVTRDVIGLSMRIHTALGPGLFESVYETVLAGKLTEIGYTVERQRAINIEFEGTQFPNAFKIDLLVDRQLVIEIKSVEKPNALHTQQLLTYLRLMNLPVGLVINFSCLTLKDGIRRVVNNHRDSAASAPSA
jgi:iron complex transport system substrate-binding protein